MPDIVGSLCAKKARLIKEQRDIETEYQSKKAHIGHELKMINDALATINSAIEQFLCPRCHGTGTVRVCDAAGDMDDETCPDCKGLGVVLEENHVI